jgi:hypothetical protein
MSEQDRLAELKAGTGGRWRLWGPYVSDRAWGTVREDYSADGSAWEYFPHDHARSRAYRWNEDGLAGICDEGQRLCFALALWNGRDPFLKERLFGLSGHEGNHGEDVKECYWHLDNTPTHAYMKWLYKYPQQPFPYRELVEENRRRGRDQPEFELADSGAFADDRYFDVLVEYAKAGPDDLLIRISVTNRAAEPASIDVLPTLWFRNTWSWNPASMRPELRAIGAPASVPTILAEHRGLGSYWLVAGAAAQVPDLLFTENETNFARLYPGGRNETPFVKDAFHAWVVDGDRSSVNPAGRGTKAALRYALALAPGETTVVRLRLSARRPAPDAFGDLFDGTIESRRAESAAFYSTVVPPGASEDCGHVMRQAFAGLLWSKQFYHFDVRRWLEGDPTTPPPPEERWGGRNREWLHLNNHDVVSMPDKWEYPWYAAWDLSFHCIPMALVDAEFAKEQLVLLLREWYMHPNGQLPAYEWSFGDVNPPVHAWAAMRVYQIDRRIHGAGDTRFLERVFHKLLLNFTWWVNRKDASGRNVFQAGFLGLDNIGVFDPSTKLPFDGFIDQSDCTSWMAMYCLNMLAIALELARHNSVYEDVATKFLEHFFYIAHAMNDRPATRADDGVDLWDGDEGFYYDVVHFEDGRTEFLRVRSLVGLIPLLAVETLDADALAALPGFRRRLEWFLTHRSDLTGDAAPIDRSGQEGRRLLAIVDEPRLRRVLERMLDEREFLSSFGIRSLSRWHLDHPFRLDVGGSSYEVGYQPAESRSAMFGGNSNWRGPIWFPINYLLIESLQRFDHYFGPGFKVECPVGSGRMLTLAEVATELSRRLIRIFVRDDAGRRPVLGANEKFQSDPWFRDHIPFFEYFDGDTGRGLGASHQTGWTALVAKLIQQSG